MDPFEYLPAELTCMIFDILGPLDTERLRRVSRYWKTLSQFYNGSRAIKRYCPRAYLPATAATESSANALFRRWLRTEHSVGAGLAQNAVRSCGVTMWVSASIPPDCRLYIGLNIICVETGPYKAIALAEYGSTGS